MRLAVLAGGDDGAAGGPATRHVVAQARVDRHAVLAGDRLRRLGQALGVEPALLLLLGVLREHDHPRCPADRVAVEPAQPPPEWLRAPRPRAERVGELV